MLFAADTKLLTREDILTLCADNAAPGARRDRRRHRHRPRRRTRHGAGARHRPKRQRPADPRQRAQATSPRCAAGASRWIAASRRGAVLDTAPGPSRTSRAARRSSGSCGSGPTTRWRCAAMRLQLAVADSRKRYGLADVVGRRALSGNLYNGSRALARMFHVEQR